MWIKRFTEQSDRFIDSAAATAGVDRDNSDKQQ